jgi:hypothetical protein
MTHSQTPVGSNMVNVFTFVEPLNYNQSVNIAVIFQATGDNVFGLTTAIIDGHGMDISPNTGRIDTANIGRNTADSKLFLPVVIKK